MRLFTINDHDNIIAQISADVSLLGKFCEEKPHVKNPHVPPRALPCRKFLLALQEPVREDRIWRSDICGGIQLTEWVSLMTTAVE